MNIKELAQKRDEHLEDAYSAFDEAIVQLKKAREIVDQMDDSSLVHELDELIQKSDSLMEDIPDTEY